MSLCRWSQIELAAGIWRKLYMTIDNMNKFILSWLLVFNWRARPRLLKLFSDYWLSLVGNLFFWRFSLLDVTVILRVDSDDNHFVASNLQNAIAGSLVQFWVSWWWGALSFCLWEWSSLRMTLLTWPRLAGLHLFGSTIEIKKIYKLIWVKTYNFTILTELMFSKNSNGVCTKYG